MNEVDHILASGVIEPVTEITSWLDGRSLGEVPITQGEVVETAGGDTLARLEFTLPATDEWMPRDPGHALAPFGQELVVRRGFRLRDGAEVGWEILGRFRITTTEPADGWVTITADSIDVRLTMARWIVDTTTTGTMAAQARQICAGIVGIRVDAPDRSAPPRLWEGQETRRESLLELCDAWGTTLRMIDGQLAIVPKPTDETPAVTITSGDRGTLVKAVPERLTAPATNIVVASSAPTDETPVVSAMAVIPYGPRAWDGPYGQAVTFYASPVLTTVAQCQDAALTRLARLQAKAPDILVEAITDPRTRLDTVVRVVDTPTGTDASVRVVEVTHALTRGKEPGQFRGAYLSGLVEGSVSVPEAPAAKVRRVALRPVWAGSWSLGSWGRPDVVQWVDGRGGVWYAYGAAFYGTMPPNIQSASVRLTRNGDGPATALTPVMRLFEAKAQPSAVRATATGPALRPGETVDWPLPVGWVTLLNSGGGAVGVKSDGVVPQLTLLASGLGMTLTVTVSDL